MTSPKPSTMTDLSDAGLDELLRLREAAGDDWQVYCDHFVGPRNGAGLSAGTRDNALLIAAAVNALPALVKEVRELRASAKRSAELERIQCGEGSRRSPQGALAHGMGEDFGPLEGCGIRCNVRSQAYRCAECSVAFCKACLIKHFAKSEKHADAKLNAIESWIAEVEQLHSQLAATERARDEAMAALEMLATYDDAGLTYCGRCDRVVPECEADLRRGCVGRLARSALAPRPDADTR